MPREGFGAADPDAVALALERGGVRIVGEHFADFGAGKLGLVFGEVQLRELHAGARMSMSWGSRANAAR